MAAVGSQPPAAIGPGPRVDQTGPDGHDGGLRAVADAEFREHVAHMRLDRLLGQRELARDALVRKATGDQDQHLALAGSQAVERPPAAVGRQRLHEPCGHHGIEQRFAGVGRTHGAHELLRLRILEQVPGGARPESRQQRLIVEKAGQHDHARIRDGLAQRTHRRHAVEPRHHEVHQDHVRVQARRRLDRILAVDGLADDRDPLLKLEEPTQPFTDHRVVVDDEHADLLSHRRPSG